MHVLHHTSNIARYEPFARLTARQQRGPPLVQSKVRDKNNAPTTSALQPSGAIPPPPPLNPTQGDFHVAKVPRYQAARLVRLSRPTRRTDQERRGDSADDLRRQRVRARICRDPCPRRTRRRGLGSVRRLAADYRLRGIEDALALAKRQRNAIQCEKMGRLHGKRPDADLDRRTRFLPRRPICAGCGGTGEKNKGVRRRLSIDRKPAA